MYVNVPHSRYGRVRRMTKRADAWYMSVYGSGSRRLFRANVHYMFFLVKNLTTPEDWEEWSQMSDEEKQNWLE